MLAERNALCLNGKLIVFEGLEGVDKSTLLQAVNDNLRTFHKEVLFLSFPGREDNSLGKLVYDIHHNKKALSVNNLSSASLQILYVAAHVDCIERRIIPALSEGKIVILDRYWWSTFAYGQLSEVSNEFLRAIIQIEMLFWGSIKPNKLFLIIRDDPFRVETSNRHISQLHDTYRRLCLEEKNNYPIKLINNKTIEKITKIVMSELHDVFSETEIEHNKLPIDIAGSKKDQCTFPFHNAKKQITKKTINKNWIPTKTTEVFDTYWYFAAERQNIFLKRFNGVEYPWTDDHILQEYKFTNAYRASDRVSQFLIRNVIYNGEQEPNEIFFRILLFKTFNKIETWQTLLSELGCISWREFHFRSYDQILTKLQKMNKSIYSAAYIMPSGKNSFGHQTKHRNHLRLIHKMIEDELPNRICDSKSMQEVFELLRSYPMIGDFLAYQYAIDINYSNMTDFKEMSFVVPGPGAKDGIRKCFADFGGLNEVDLIKLMTDRQESEFLRLGIEFKSLWGRSLQLIDCQNLFCEVDKYARIAHPEVKGVTGRSRIKQKFKPTLELIEYFYPPKWNLNDAIAKSFPGKCTKKENVYGRS